MVAPASDVQTAQTNTLKNGNHVGGSLYSDTSKDAFIVNWKVEDESVLRVLERTWVHDLPSLSSALFEASPADQTDNLESLVEAELFPQAWGLI